MQLMPISNATDFSKIIIAADFEYLSNVLKFDLLETGLLRNCLPSTLCFSRDLSQHSWWHSLAFDSGSCLEPSVRFFLELFPENILAETNISSGRLELSFLKSALRHQYFDSGDLFYNDWGHGPWENLSQYLGNLTSCCSLIDPKWGLCQLGFQEFQRNWYTNISLGSLGFDLNCEITPKFWNNYIFNNPGTAWWATPPAVDLFRNFLPENHSQAPADEVQYILMKMLINENFLVQMSTAANSCQPEYCHIINFDGNADIAGKGLLWHIV